MPAALGGPRRAFLLTFAGNSNNLWDVILPVTTNAVGLVEKVIPVAQRDLRNTVD
jgi:hypothetical protein